jgi:hypothetical protein
MKKKPAKRGTTRTTKRATKGLPAARAATVKGGTENQVFTSASNVLKTRHDTAKSSISNIR